jgi:hypothetical protein
MSKDLRELLRKRSMLCLYFTLWHAHCMDDCLIFLELFFLLQKPFQLEVETVFARGLIYPLIPTWATPSINCFWKMKNGRIIGMTAITAPAICPGKLLRYCPCKEASTGHRPLLFWSLYHEIKGSSIFEAYQG